MKKSPLFYYLLEYVRKEKQSAYENLLLTLSSNVLRRKIVFISIFEDMETHSSEFEPADDSKSKTVYYIAGARKYFFLSIFKQNLWFLSSPLNKILIYGIKINLSYHVPNFVFFVSCIRIFSSHSKKFHMGNSRLFLKFPTQKYWELAVLKNSVFLSRHFEILFSFSIFFASSPWKVVKVSWIARMDWNF